MKPIVARTGWLVEHATLDAAWQNRIEPVQDHLIRVMDALQRRCMKGAFSPGCR